MGLGIVIVIVLVLVLFQPSISLTSDPKTPKTIPFLFGIDSTRTMGKRLMPNGPNPIRPVRQLDSYS